MAVYGIDFGTCYSCIAVAENDGRISVIPSARSQNTTPSVVMFNARQNGKPVVGETAKRAFNQPNPKNVVAFIKTELKEELTSKEYQTKSEELRRLYTIEPVSCIYNELFHQSNLFRHGLGKETINEAVITVPAVCSDIQREKTKLAAELAGIRVLRVISEPTAAAISYDIQIGETIAVFDLGGGTLDVSIIRRLSDSDYKVLSTEGNPNLGGKNWDESLIQMCYENLGLSCTPDCITQQSLINFEGYKIDICEAGSADIAFVDNDGVQRLLTVDIEEFEQYSALLIDKAMSVIDIAIESAKRNDSDLKIDRICLAGGSSKMPAIQQGIRRHFPEIKVDLSDPNQAIAKGAARYGLSITNGKSNYDINIEDKGHAYGILTTDNHGNNVVANIIPKDAPMIIENVSFDRYMPVTSNHLHITIIESDQANDRFKYRNQDAFFSGEVEFPQKVSIGEKVSFSLSRDNDGIVHLTVSCKGKNNDFSFATKANPIPENICKIIREHISKMNNQQ